MNGIVHDRDTDDPRPVLAEDNGHWVICGFRCTECGYRLASLRPRCPVCRSSLEEHQFGPEGSVWAGTILRAGVPERVAPLGLAYVDLDDGPRVLCHFGDAGAVAEVPAPGARVQLAGLTEQGDPKVRIL